MGPLRNRHPPDGASKGASATRRARTKLASRRVSQVTAKAAKLGRWTIQRNRFGAYPSFSTRLRIKDVMRPNPVLLRLVCMGHRMAHLANDDHNWARILRVGSPEKLNCIILLGGSPQRRRLSLEHADPQSFISMSTPTARSKTIRTRQRASENENGYCAAVPSSNRGSFRRARRARGFRWGVFATGLGRNSRSDRSQWRGQIHTLACDRRFLAAGIRPYIMGGARSHRFDAPGRAPPLRRPSRRAEIGVDSPRKPRHRPGTFRARPANPVRGAGPHGVSPRSRSACRLSLRGTASPRRIGPAPDYRSPSMAARRTAYRTRPACSRLAEGCCSRPSRKRRIDARRNPRTTRSTGDNPAQARSEVKVVPLGYSPYLRSRLSQSRERRGHAALSISQELSRRDGDAGWGP
ncbi:hypothetical protein CDS [Bradyrhizobium sp.]|nr:hypothetical protein CDS [Bradyrhizobium sp.]